MGVLRPGSIRHKLIAGQVIVCIFGLLAACAAFVLYDRMSYARQKQHTLTVLGDSIAGSLAGAVAFADADACKYVLRSLEAEPTALSGVVNIAIDGQNKRLALWQRNSIALPAEPGDLDIGESYKGFLRIAHPIRNQDGQTLGTLVTTFSTDDVDSRTWRFLGIALVVLLLTGITVVLVSMPASRLIADPFTAESEKIHAQLRGLHAILPGALVVVSLDGRIIDANHAAETLLGFAPGELIGCHANAVSAEIAALVDRMRENPGIAAPVAAKEQLWKSKVGTNIPVLVSTAVTPTAAASHDVAIFLGTDLRERHQAELELRHAQKLESVGQLAAGIAHEINTPMQFIGDNISFLKDAFGGVQTLVEAYAAYRQTVPNDASRDASAALEQAELTADWAYLREQVPTSLRQAIDGVRRVTSIVSAMKAFSHAQPGKGPVDLASILETTLTVARNEYKYVADVNTTFDALPKVHGNSGDLHQLFLNLVINAAHAVGERVKGTQERGVIAIRTSASQDMAVVAVSDNGCGIPEDIRHRIFEPFFTTKEVGKGTGQGLCLARSIVAGHGGSISFESAAGKGTTFLVRLPIAGGST